MCHDIYLQKNEIEIEDSQLGFYDEPNNYTYLDDLFTNSVFTKPYGVDYFNVDKPNMLFYWNFVMIHDAQLNQRVRYTLMEILGEIGGVFEGTWVMLMIFFYIYNYK